MDEHKLKHTFADCLGLPLSAIDDALAYDSVPQWDSVAHMALIAAIEEAFDILVDTDDVIDMSTYAKARDLVAKHLGVRA